MLLQGYAAGLGFGTRAHRVVAKLDHSGAHTEGDDSLVALAPFDGGNTYHRGPSQSQHGRQTLAEP